MPSNKNIINIDKWWKYNERWWPKWFSIKCSFQGTMVHYNMIEWAIQISNALYEGTIVWACVATSNL
jgi:hypothetical protein